MIVFCESETRYKKNFKKRDRRKVLSVYYFSPMPKKGFTNNVIIIFIGLIKETKKNILRLQCQKMAATKSLDLFLSKIEFARKLNEKITELKQKAAFMNDKQICEEQEKTKEKLEKPLEILKNIEELEQQHPDYLNPNQIETLKTELSSRKSFLKGQSDETRDPDLECVICKSLPDGHVYSCGNGHLLCPTCLSRVVQCPICQENFKEVVPKRNCLAERLNAQKQSPSKLRNRDNSSEKKSKSNIFCWGK